MPRRVPRWAGMTPSQLPGGPGRRPDASMTLLREVMERPLDPGYQQAADRPRQRGLAPLVLTLALAALAGYLTITAVGQLQQPAPQVARERARLQQEIAARTAAADSQRRANEQLQAQNAAAQAAALGTGPGAALAADVARLELSTGEAPVVGSGVRFVLADAPGTGAAGDPRNGGSAPDGRILDRDLQVVVNGLWAAGAEAVAVNGERLTALSAIRSAGDAILVGFRPLQPPYVVAAIGNASSMQSGFAAGDAGTYVQSLRNNYGISVTVTDEARLALPGAGPLLLRSVRPTPAATP